METEDKKLDQPSGGKVQREEIDKKIDELIKILGKDYVASIMEDRVKDKHGNVILGYGDKVMKCSNLHYDAPDAEKYFREVSIEEVEKDFSELEEEIRNDMAVAELSMIHLDRARQEINQLKSKKENKG